MALSDYQAEGLLTQTPFLMRIALNLGIIVQNIESEATSTALHAQRIRLANQIVTNVSFYVNEFASQVITQLPLATTNLVTANGVTNGDVDTTDASLQTILSSIYNDFVSQS